MTENKDVAQYKQRYVKLYDFIKSYNRGEVDPRLLGRIVHEPLRYTITEIGGADQVAAFFKTNQKGLLGKLIDKSGEWFDYGTHEDGLLLIPWDLPDGMFRIPKMKYRQKGFVH